MQFVAGSRLGPYEIVAPVGAGGMGEVYRARDSRLDRDVAIKVLPSHLSSNPQLRERFDREARAISSLSHPHVCTLHDVGHQDGIDFLVMEFLEGETLSDRLSRGPLPLKDVLRYGAEIADALDRAHRQTIVHRDLKPGNVMLTKSGAKVLDFGLAKYATGNSELGTRNSILATEHRPLTQEGMILGTIQYMAPEQLEGKEADARTDIFALGAILYEMATGKRAFEGKSKASLIASIMQADPAPMSIIQPVTPPAFDRVVRTCLEKDPDERWQSAHDVARELKWISDTGSQAGVAAPIHSRRRSRELLAWSVAFILLLTTLVLAASRLRQTSDQGQSSRTLITPPAGTGFDFGDDNAAALTLSPDGRLLTFVSSGPQGTPMIWVRPLNSLDAKPLPGTEGAVYPFWSPDSRYLGFFADRKLKKVPVAGGPILVVCDVREPRGGTWNKDDVILFAPHWRDPIHRVSAAGGASSPLTRIDEAKKETTHRWPHFLPDGEHFLYLAGSHLVADPRSGDNAVYIASLRDPQKPRLLLHARSNVVYAGGYLLFVRERSLVAQRFDLRKLRLIGEAAPVADRIRYETGFFRAVFAAADHTLVYQEGGTETLSQMTWVDRTGKEVGLIGDQGSFFDMKISPNGKFVAVAVGDSSDIWLYEPGRMGRTRLTFAPLNEFQPVWSPDGRSIVYSSDRNVSWDMQRKPAIGSAAGEETLLANPSITEFATDWSADGRLIAFDFEDLRKQATSDVWILPLSGDRKPYAFLATQFNENDGHFSPDGRWLAFSSDASGRPEIYVASLRNAREQWQVSTAGGVAPRWSAGGREMFYVSSDKKLMAVQVSGGDSFEAGEPRALFPVSLRFPNSYDVAKDGRFLLNRVPSDRAVTPITVVMNWSAELKQ